MDGLGAFRWVLLDDVDEADRDALRQVRHAGSRRPLESNGSETQGEMGLAPAAIHPLRQIDHRLVAKGRPLDCLVERAAVDQRLVVHGPR